MLGYQLQRPLAELLGTFALVFAGTGAIVIDQVTGGVIGHAGTALVFGLIVMAMIYTFGDVSGAHINPAVTLGFAIAGRLSWAQVPSYIIAQLLGAFMASGLLRFLFPLHPTLGATFPHGSVSQSFILEMVLTTMLMFVILSVSAGAKEKGITAGIAIGSMVALEAMFAGPISGASMNPARSLAPAILSGNVQHLWLYPVATLIGAVLAVPLYAATRPHHFSDPTP